MEVGENSICNKELDQKDVQSSRMAEKGIHTI